MAKIRELFVKEIDREIKVLLNEEMLPVSQGEGKLYSFDLLILLLSDLEEKEWEKQLEIFIYYY